MDEQEKKKMEEMIKLTLNSIITCVKKEILRKKD